MELPEIREVPDDFMPEMMDQIDRDGDEIVVSYARSSEVRIQLGFKKAGDPVVDAGRVEDLRRTTWNGLELARLGLWDEFAQWRDILYGKESS